MKLTNTTVYCVVLMKRLYKKKKTPIARSLFRLLKPRRDYLFLVLALSLVGNCAPYLSIAPKSWYISSTG